MSVNLNILANKAIKGFADTDDFVKDTVVFTSGTFYTLLDINNVQNIPFQGLPQTSSYCSQSILEWSTDSTFATGVSASVQSCNSSSLSGSLLVYASFTDTAQGGFLENNFGYTQKIFDSYGVPNNRIGINSASVATPTPDYGISLSITSGSNQGVRNWYFRNRVSSSLSPNFVGPAGSTGVSNICRTERLQRSYFFFEASGYNEETNEWYSNSFLPIWNFGTNPNDKPAPYNAKATIITGSNGFPEIIKYGNAGSGSGDLLKTNGCTFILPVQPDPAISWAGWQVCCYQGSLIAYNTETGIQRDGPNSFVHALNIPYTDTKQLGSLALMPTGSEIYSASFAVFGTADISTGQRGNMVARNMPTKGRVVSIGANYNDRLNTYNDSGYMFSYQPAQEGTDLPPYTIPNSITVITSDNCLIKFIGSNSFQAGEYQGTAALSNTGVVNPAYYNVEGQTSQVYNLYGNYTGSLGGS